MIFSFEIVVPSTYTSDGDVVCYDASDIDKAIEDFRNYASRGCPASLVACSWPVGGWFPDGVVDDHVPED